MRRRIALLLAALTAAGALTLPALAAEPAAEESAQEATEATPAEPAPDPEGTVTWENLDRRIRAGSLNAQILEENITGISVQQQSARTNKNACLVLRTYADGGGHTFRQGGRYCGKGRSIYAPFARPLHISI